jgi:diguanylate cyclase (GGDEF)-like protein
VQQVAATGEAIVVTGTDNGAALGSESAVVHGLRSILVGPVQLKGRTVGVVYLDSRIAKGIFTSDDARLLMAITNQIAVSLQTARASRLELEKAAALQQRDTAEILQKAMVSVAGSLDTEEVLRRLAEEIVRLPALPADGLWIVRRDGTVVAATVPGDPTVTVTLSCQQRVEWDDETALAAADRLLTGADLLDLPGAVAEVVGDALGTAGSWLAAPLDVTDQRVGLLLIATRAPGPYSEAQVQLAGALVSQGMAAYEKARLFARTQELAATDALTGIPNRRSFFEWAERALATARRSGRGLAVLMIDIDHFKQINDAYGHQVGDEVIQAVVARLVGELRPSDVLGRYGGEEFALVIPNASADDADGLAERLRSAVASRPVETLVGPLVVSVSIGLAPYVPAPGDAMTLHELVGRADHALYAAKQAGRDRVVRNDPRLSTRG